MEKGKNEYLIKIL